MNGGLNSEPNIDIEISSTSLGYEGNGGTIGVAMSLAERAVSEDLYTQLVVKNAEKAKNITEREFPNATFSVSALASSVNADKLKGMIGSVDYPYLVEFNKEFFDIKKQEVANQGKSGLNAMVALAQEYGYGILQSHTSKEQVLDTIKIANLIEAGKPRIRTCLETVLNEEELAKIKMVNTELGGINSVIWAIEPNKKIGDGTLDDYVNRFLQIRNDPKNKYLTFGIDLDFGGLPREDRSLFELLDRLDSNQLLPVYISLSGQEHVEQGFRTHLPLESNPEFAKKLGEWIKTRRARKLEIPSFVIETNPVQQNILEDYSNFLTSLNKGIK